MDFEFMASSPASQLAWHDWISRLGPTVDRLPVVFDIEANDVVCLSVIQKPEKPSVVSKPVVFATKPVLRLEITVLQTSWKQIFLVPVALSTGREEVERTRQQKDKKLIVFRRPWGGAVGRFVHEPLLPPEFFRIAQNSSGSFDNDVKQVIGSQSGNDTKDTG